MTSNFNVKNLLRQAKREVLYGGNSRPASLYLKEFEDGYDDQTSKFHSKGSFVVNLSFDLELALSTRFWEGEFHKSLPHGNTGRKNLLPFVKFMNSEDIPFNAQVVAALLNPEALSKVPMTKEQSDFANKNKNIFKLTEEDKSHLKSGKGEIGLHSWTHRSFTLLSREGAKEEMVLGQKYFADFFGKEAEFMSYPKNYIKHEDVLFDAGIKCYRTDSQNIKENTVPLGVWFAPLNLDEKRLRDLLKKIKNEKPDGFFLHLWGHFTEMDVEAFKKYIEIIRDESWDFVTAKEYLNNYE